MEKQTLKPFPKDKLKLFGIANDSQKEIEKRELTDYIFGNNTILKTEVFDDICRDVFTFSDEVDTSPFSVSSETKRYIESC